MFFLVTFSKFPCVCRVRVRVSVVSKRERRDPVYRVKEGEIKLGMQYNAPARKTA